MCCYSALPAQQLRGPACLRSLYLCYMSDMRAKKRTVQSSVQHIAHASTILIECTSQARMTNLVSVSPAYHVTIRYGQADGLLCAYLSLGCNRGRCITGDIRTRQTPAASLTSFQRAYKNAETIKLYVSVKESCSSLWQTFLKQHRI